MYNETLELRRRLAKDNPQEFNKDLAVTLGNLSFRLILQKDYNIAEQYAYEGLYVDPTQNWIYTNLAASLLFLGKYEEAKQIYSLYKYELKNMFLDDFNQYEKAGVIPPKHKEDVEKIKRLLNE